jgi:xyloglucan-specific exo-beta-1,4-glucanase
VPIKSHTDVIKDLAVGAYTISWDPNPGSILRSTDQGTTWEATVLPFKVGGNMPGRGIGEVRTLSPNSTITITELMI